MVGSLGLQADVSFEVALAEARGDFEDFFSECGEQLPDVHGLISGGVEDGVDDDSSLLQYVSAR